MSLIGPLFRWLKSASVVNNAETHPLKRPHRLLENGDQNAAEIVRIQSAPPQETLDKSTPRADCQQQAAGRQAEHIRNVIQTTHDQLSQPSSIYFDRERDASADTDHKSRAALLGSQDSNSSPHSAVVKITPHADPRLFNNFQSGQIPPTNSDLTTTSSKKYSLHTVMLNTAIFEPPVFGSSPHAARRPWVLPIEPAVSGITADQTRIGDLDVRAASIVGPAHRCEEPAMPRQDSYRLGRDHAGRYLIIAVADGMSDSRRSDLGARVATRCAVDTLRAHLDSGASPTPQAIEAAFYTSAGAMVTVAKNEDLTEMDVRCALIVAIIPTESNAASGSRRAWFATLADVSAWLRHDNGWRCIAGDQKKGDLHSNALHNFLPHHPNSAVTTPYDLEPGAVVAVVTDGVGDAFSEVPNAAQWFAQRWETPVPLESFLLDVGYHARGQLDDRTSVTVWCQDGARSSQ